jgi:hypothetical protein
LKGHFISVSKENRTGRVMAVQSNISIDDENYDDDDGHIKRTG